MIGDSTDPELAEPLRLLDDWTREGAHRRDLDADNVYEHSPAVALMDAWWDQLMRDMFTPALGTDLVERIRAMNPFVQLPGPGGSAFFDGWMGYVDKDLRSLLGDPVEGPLSRRYCGGGDLAACRLVVTNALKAAAGTVREGYGTDLAGVRIRATGCEQDITCDQIEFTTAGAVETPPIPWQDRPTFQQVVEVGTAQAAATPTPTPTAAPAATATPQPDSPTTRETTRDDGDGGDEGPSDDGRRESGADDGDGELPFTGFSLGAIVLAAIGLLLGGGYLRRRS